MIKFRFSAAHSVDFRRLKLSFFPLNKEKERKKSILHPKNASSGMDRAYLEPFLGISKSDIFHKRNMPFHLLKI